MITKKKNSTVKSLSFDLANTHVTYIEKLECYALKNGIVDKELAVRLMSGYGRSRSEHERIRSHVTLHNDPHWLLCRKILTSGVELGENEKEFVLSVMEDCHPTKKQVKNLGKIAVMVGFENPNNPNRPKIAPHIKLKNKIINTQQRYLFGANETFLNNLSEVFRPSKKQQEWLNNLAYYTGVLERKN